MTNIFAIDIKCWKCKGCHDNLEDLKEKLHDDVDTVNDFSYLGDRTNIEDGCEVAVTFGTRFGCVRYRECQDSHC